MMGFKYGSLPTLVAERSMRLLADKAMPELKAFHPEPLSV